MYKHIVAVMAAWSVHYPRDREVMRSSLAQVLFKQFAVNAAALMQLQSPV